MSYIEVLGVMGTGKSSLCRLLEKQAGFSFIEESDEDLQRMFCVKNYLSDPKRYGFAGAVNFIAFNLNRTIEKLETIADRQNIVTDSPVFMQYAYSEALLSRQDFDLIKAVLERSYQYLPKIDLRIVTTLPIDENVKRIAQRGRATEASVPRSYIENAQTALNTAINLHSQDIPVLYLDSSKFDWANNTEDQKLVIALIRQKLSEASAKPFEPDQGDRPEAPPTAS